MSTWVKRRGQIKHLLYEMCLTGRIDKATFAEQIKDLNSVEPRKHGRWIEEGLVDGNQNRYCRCSECGKSDTQAISQRVPYCWWCGAKMDEGEE